MGILFKLFHAEGGCNSFVVADERTRKACVIDPRADEIDLLEAYVAANKLSVALVADTHTHADHYSGTHLVAQHFGAPIAMSGLTKSARAAIKVQDGQSLEVGGELAVRVVQTPGHTPDSVSFAVSGPFGQAVFTGDTLFIGGSGRTDFPEADPIAQYESIYSRLGGLDAGSWVLPGHDYSGLLFSTLAHEKKTNPHWQFKDRDAFVAMKNAEALESSGALPNIINFNLSATPTSRPRAGAHTMCATLCADMKKVSRRMTVAELKQALADNGAGRTLFIDVREPEECAKARVPGMLNIPLSQLFVHWNELARANQVVFFCQEGKRSIATLQTALRLGLDQATDVEGGLIAWIAAGNPIDR